MKPNALRIAVILVYAGVAGMLAGYFGGRMATAENVRVALQPHDYMAPAPRDWAEI